MIEINDMRIDSRYWFDLGMYKAFGRYTERDGNIFYVDEALIYMKDTANRSFFEERLLIDALKLRNITIEEPDGSEDNSAYYAGYDYVKDSFMKF